MIKTLDQYIDQFPEDTQNILNKVREIIKEIAPDAEELISYKMPTFDLNGHRIYFAAYKNHIGFYAIYTSITGNLEKELAPFRTTKDTIQFKLNEPIPYNLIEKIVRLKLIN